MFISAAVVASLHVETYIYLSCNFSTVERVHLCFLVATVGHRELSTNSNYMKWNVKCSLQLANIAL